MKNRQWDLEQARQLYNLEHWSDGFFDIGPAGQLIMRRPDWPDHPGINLLELAERLHQEHIGPPVLVRFKDILGARVNRLYQAFTGAAQTLGYTGQYTAIYPIKVNQQGTVVERILAEPDVCVGLEAGSKPELMAVLGIAPPGSVIVCNGYKDAEYLRLAMIGLQLGHRVFIILEKLTELEILAERVKMQPSPMLPLLGVRLRLSSIGKGKWQNTGGEKAKFGLSAVQVLELLTRLRSLGWLKQLELLHFHMGSQIANIRDIQTGMGEAAQYYAALRTAGANIQVVDVGGGLGIDYEGTRSRNDCSINYSIEEYALNILRPLQRVCKAQNLPMPALFTESGRAMTAHHAVLITNVIEVEQAPGLPSQPVECAQPDEGDGSPTASMDDTDAAAAGPAPVLPTPARQDAGASIPVTSIPRLVAETMPDAGEIIEFMRDLRQDPQRSSSEIFHDVAFSLVESQAMFSRGILSLEERAHAEELYFSTCRYLMENDQHSLPNDIQAELLERLADKYFCNFSVFQSMPDAWAIDQIFPIMPLHRLQERPTRRAVLQDLTCDSDGRIDAYAQANGISSTLPVHALQKGSPYYLGFFLVGAYQEILGGLHNLFGDTDVINIELLRDGGYRLAETVRGGNVEELLHSVHIHPEKLRRVYRDKVYAAGLRGPEAGSLLTELEHGLLGYTYLEE